MQQSVINHWISQLFIFSSEIELGAMISDVVNSYQFCDGANGFFLNCVPNIFPLSNLNVLTEKHQ